MPCTLRTTIHVRDAKRFTYPDALEACNFDLDNIFYVKHDEAFPDGPSQDAQEEVWIVSVFIPYDPDHILHAQPWNHYAWIAKDDEV